VVREIRVVSAVVPIGESVTIAVELTNEAPRPSGCWSTYACLS
jgi:hypothetical protein